MQTAEQPILPVGNVLEWYFQQPAYVQRRFLPLARKLVCKGETWQDKQRMARELWKAIDDFYDPFDPEPAC